MVLRQAKCGTILTYFLVLAHQKEEKAQEPYMQAWAYKSQ